MSYSVESAAGRGSSWCSRARQPAAASFAGLEDSKKLSRPGADAGSGLQLDGCFAARRLTYSSSWRCRDRASFGLAQSRSRYYSSASLSFEWELCPEESHTIQPWTRPRCQGRIELAASEKTRGWSSGLPLLRLSLRTCGP